MPKRSWQTRHPGPATYSPCGTFRYRLERPMQPGTTAAFIMVNPSTATEQLDDQTILMVQSASSTLGFGRAIIGNLFAYRSKEVTDLGKVADPVGPENDEHLRRIAAEADEIVVAWGAPGKLPVALRQRWRGVVEILDAAGKPLRCLKHLKGNHPRHPQVLRFEHPLPNWQRPE